jgi:hypothetical protein
MRARRIGRWGAGCALLVGAAAAISGCGTSSTIDPVAQAATRSTSAPGFRMTLAMNLSNPQLPGPITGTGSGSFQTHNHLGSMSMSMSLGALGSNPQVQQALGGSTLRIDEVVDHLTVYMKLPSALARKLPGGKPWWKINLAKAASSLGMPGLSTLASNPAGNDPSQMLGYLRASSGQFKNLGQATINGVRTTHYSASIDFNKIPDRFPPSERGAVKQAVTTLRNMAHLSALPVDVWIDQHHLVRRTAFGINEQLPGIGPMHLSMRMDFTDYGPQPAPSLPPASQVRDISSLAGAGSSGL